MRLFLAALLALVALAAPALAAEPVQSTIALTGPVPVLGGTVTFLETYPQDAAKQSRQNQYPGSPQTQVDCWQGGVPVFMALAFPEERTKVPGGWQATTNPLSLGGRYPGGAYWLSGPADCRAILFSNDSRNVQHVWAWMYFTAGG